jgi:hypothetical protein
MTKILFDIGDIRNASENAQRFTRLAMEERNPKKRAEYMRRARAEMTLVEVKTVVVRRAMDQLQDDDASNGDTEIRP